MTDDFVGVRGSFQPSTTLLGCSISQVIHNLCPSILLIKADISKQKCEHSYSLAIEKEWHLKKYSNVAKLCLKCLEINELDQIASTHHSFAQIAIEMNKNSQSSLMLSKNWQRLNLLLENNMDCNSDPQYLNDNQLLMLYANMIILLFQNKQYLQAQKLNIQLFSKFHHLFSIQKCKNWRDFIQLWKKKANDDNFLSWILKYSSIIILFVIFLCVQFQLPLKFESNEEMEEYFENIEWIVEYLFTKNEFQPTIILVFSFYIFISVHLMHILIKSKDELFVIRALSQMKRNNFEDALYDLEHSSLPLSLFIQGWIYFYHLSAESKACQCWKQCVIQYSFEIAECSNLFAIMDVSHGKFKKAIDNLRHALAKNHVSKKLHFNLAQILILQGKLLHAKDELHVMGKVDVHELRRKCKIWETEFAVLSTHISPLSLKRIECQLYLCENNWQKSKSAYESLILNIQSLQESKETEAVEMDINVEYCSVLIALKEWTMVQNIANKYEHEFSFRLALIHSFLEQDKYENAEKVLQKMRSLIKKNNNKKNEKDFKIVCWWYYFYCGLVCVGKMKDAYEHFENALLFRPNCLLTNFYAVNISMSMNDNSSGNRGINACETALIVCWLELFGIPLHESKDFYTQYMNNNQQLMETFITPQVLHFRQLFSYNALQPSFCANSAIIYRLLKFDCFQVKKSDLVDITLCCMRKWWQITMESAFIPHRNMIVELCASNITTVVGD